MKEISQSIIKSTKSLLGRLTTVTTLGCLLALVFLVAASPQPQKSGKAQPFKASGIVAESVFNADGSGNMVVVGVATHLGKFVSTANWVYVPTDGTLYVWANFTAANGDTLQAEFPAWVATGNSGVAIITGGTGRFANASGSYVATFSGADLEIFSVEGTISY